MSMITFLNKNDIVEKYVDTKIKVEDGKLTQAKQSVKPLSKVSISSMTTASVKQALTFSYVIM